MMLAIAMDVSAYDCLGEGESCSNKSLFDHRLYSRGRATTAFVSFGRHNPHTYGAVALRPEIRIPKVWSSRNKSVE
jgi:hypothetical protein